LAPPNIKSSSKSNLIVYFFDLFGAFYAAIGADYGFRFSFASFAPSRWGFTHGLRNSARIWTNIYLTLSCAWF